MREGVDDAGGEGVRGAAEDVLREVDVLIDPVGGPDSHRLCCGAARALRAEASTA
ncbi:hypothetical protein [Streptomyces atratus]